MSSLYLISVIHQHDSDEIWVGAILDEDMRKGQVHYSHDDREGLVAMIETDGNQWVEAVVVEQRTRHFTPITIEQCQCGYSHCRDYWLVGIGKFVQGSGFTKIQAEVIAELLNDRPELLEAIRER